MINWPYIAGFFDGEGNIAIKRHSKHWGYGYPVCRTTQVGQRGLEVLTKIKLFLESEGIVSRISVVNRDSIGTQTCYILTSDGWLGVKAFLIGVLPYLEVKRTEAQDILRYRKLYPTVPRRDVMLKAWVTRRANKAVRC